MIASIEGFFSSFISAMTVFGGWISAVPKALAEGFTWFHSKKINIPDTEQGRRLKQALLPDSSFDKLAQTWAYASFGAKGAILVGTTLVFGVLGLVFGASVLLSLTSLVLGLGIHGLLVSHHEGRVKRIMSLVKQQETLREEVEKALVSIKSEVLDFIQTQKKETEATFVQFKKETQELANAVTVVDEQVSHVISVNKQLVDAGKHIEATLNHLGSQALLWENELKKNQKELATVINATNTLSGLVDGITSSHQLFDTTVSQLHEAVEKLTTSSENGDALAEDILGGFSVYTQQSKKMLEQSHQMLEQLKESETLFEERKKTVYKDSDLFFSEAFMAEQRERIQATKKELEHVEIRQKQRAMLAATDQKVLEEAPIQTPHQQKEERSSVLSSELDWLESVNSSVRARQERMETLIKEHNATRSAEAGTVPGHDAFIHSIEDELKTRAEQRKARLVRLEAYGRFFSETEHDAAPGEVPVPGHRAR